VGLRVGLRRLTRAVAVTRLSFKPVDAWFLARHPHPNEREHSNELVAGVPSSRRIAAHLNATASLVRKWRQLGIPLWDADAAAITLGKDPYEFWPYFDEIEPFWCTTPWLRGLRTRAVLESWRQRVDCDGSAGGMARRMFNEVVA